MKDLSLVLESCDYFYDGEPEALHANLIMWPTGDRSEDRKEKFKENNYSFNIYPDHWKQIGRDIYTSAITYPAIFGDSIHSIYDYCHEFKATDWWYWTYKFVRIYLKDLLPKWYYEPYMLLLDAIDLATSRIISKDNIKVIHNNIITFLWYYEADYQENLFSRVTFWKLVFHQLLHVVDCITDLGPM